jgi:hypothetical protein
MIDWNSPFALSVIVAGTFGLLGLLYRWLGNRPADARASFAIVALGVVLAAFLSTVSGFALQQRVRGNDSKSRAAGNAIAWVQYGLSQPDGGFYSPAGVIARVLLPDDGACPSITVDGGQPQPMAKRDDPRTAAFGHMCDYRLPTKLSRVAIAYTGQKPLLNQEISDTPARIAVLGDTGCRIASYTDQGCDSATTWPFRDIVDAATAQQPKLVIHLGDYFYRETPCDGKAAPEKCTIGPYGDREATWRSEFFEPAKPLLKQSPWIFVRGNHEDCTRGGYGWFYYFGDGNKPCEQYHRPAYIPLAGLTLLHFDTAHADDEYAVEKVNNEWENLEKQIAALPKDDRRPIVVLTHKPVYALCQWDEQGKPDGCEAKNVANLGGARAIVNALQAADRRTVAFSGDLHMFQSYDINTVTALPATQIILGNGGTALEKSENFLKLGAPWKPQYFTFLDLRLGRDKNRKWAPYKESEKPEEPKEPTSLKGQGQGSSQTWINFGFGIVDLVDRPKPAMMLSVHQVDGRKIATCDLTSEQVPTTGRCAP